MQGVIKELGGFESMLRTPVVIEVAATHGDVVGSLVDHVRDGRHLVVILVINQVRIELFMLIYRVQAIRNLCSVR